MDQIWRKGLSLLLEGVESVCGLKERTPFRKFWSEGDRVYSLELRGRGLVGGWKMLASKLRSVGVAPLQWSGVCWINNRLPKPHPSSSVGRGLCPLPESPRASRCRLARNWRKKLWIGMRSCWAGNLWLSNVRENLMLLEFEFEDEAERVFSSGIRSFRGRSFRLEKWKPSVGCLEGDNEETRHVWVRILGLPLHLWGRKPLQAVRRRLWEVVAGATCYALQLWWEEEPCLSSVIPACRSGAWKIGDDVVAPSRAMGSVDPQTPASVTLQPEKLLSPTLGTVAPTQT
ncbi:hypothetical protein CK203_018807 [Vitis vinifera]|uniref:Uncharacterized protein n=1 Tax=Vitis vinifera TaxID=29760 RepID=A0A438JAI2_VITVI|nr:hypothetical protein CK203_018807 [Vitis vinifera]